ncbi:MAG TPA: NUDIX hydrolase [Clostridium sp.]|nr:NUDIX hydrolase [Clostridium sp.]
MELWDIYDKNRIKTGRTMIRGYEFEDGAHHMVIHVCIFNSQGKMLIQQRQPFKDGWPNMWDFTVGGSALAGESSAEAAEREVFEEIGYSVDLHNTRPYFTINFKNGFDDFYLIHADVNLNDLKLQYEEVQNVKYADRDEIIAMINDGCFIPYYRSFVDLLFEMKDNNAGIHK